MPPPNFNSPVFFFSSVWDYVPTRFYLAGDVDEWRASDLTADGYDRVDPSPRDQQISTCLKYRLSEAIDTAFRHMEEPRASDLRRDGRLAVDSLLDRDLTATVTRDRDHPTHLSIAIRRLRWRAIVTIHLTWKSIPRQRKIVEELHDRGLIEPHSQRDRAAIEEISSRNHHGIVAIRSNDDRRRPRTTIDARSWRFWSEIEAQSTTKSGRNCRGIKATTNAQRTAPTTPLIKPHDRFNCPRS